MLITLRKADGTIVEPSYATERSAGFDLAMGDDHIQVQDYAILVPTGLYIASYRTLMCCGEEVIPYLSIVPKSGKSARTCWRVSNSPGTVDADYPGEIMVMLERYVPLTLSSGETCFTDMAHHCLLRPDPGDLIAQAVVSLTCRPAGGVTRVGGFGSTGG